MSIEEIAKISALPNVTIGSHSVTHTLLSTCTEDELRREINDSKRDLELWTGRPVRAFSYPDGNYDHRVAAWLARAGYSLAFTTEHHPLTLSADPYYMPRCSVMDDGSLTENLCHAFSLWRPRALDKKGRGDHDPKLRDEEQRTKKVFDPVPEVMDCQSGGASSSRPNVEA